MTDTDRLSELAAIRAAGHRTLTIQERAAGWYVVVVDHDTWQRAESGDLPTFTEAADKVIAEVAAGALAAPYGPGAA